MKWIVRLGIAACLLAACVVLAWWVAEPRLEDYARRLAVEELGKVFQTEARLGRATFQLFPPRLRIDGLEVGPHSEVLRIEEAKVALLPYASAIEGRPVIDLEAESVLVDVTRLPKSDEPRDETQDGFEKTPALKLRRARIGRARVLLPGGRLPFDLSAEHLELRFASRRGGRMLGRARLEGFRIARGGETFDAGRLQLALARTRGGFRVDSLSVEGPSVRITGSVAGRDPLRHHLKAEVEIAPIARFDPDLSGLEGKVEIDATLEGPLEDPAASGRLRTTGIVFRGQELDGLEAEVVWRDGRVEVQRARALGFGGEAAFSGSISFSERVPFTVDASWKGIAVERVVAAAGTDFPRRIVSEGTAKASGDLDGLRIETSGSGRFSGEGIDIDWQGEGSGGREAQQVRLTAVQGSANSLRAAVSADANRRLDGELNVELADTARFGALFGAGDLPPISGRLTTAARLSGTVEQPALDGRIDGRDVAALGVRFNRAGGPFHVDRERLASEGLEIGIGRGSVRASGTIGLAPHVENAWRAEIRDVAVTDAAAIARSFGQDLPLTAGTLSVTADGSGPWTSATVKANASVDDLGIGEERFERLNVAANGTWPRWNAAAELVHAGDERLSVRGGGEGARVLSAEIDSTRWSLDRVAAARGAKVAGRFSMQASLAGPLSALDGNGQATLEDLEWNGRWIGDTTLRAEVRRGAWSVAGELAEWGVRADGRVTPAGAFALDAELADAHLGRFLGDDPTLVVDASGTLHVSGRFDAPRRIDGDIELPRLVIATGSFRAEATAPVRVSARSGRFQIESFRLEGSDTELEASGTADTTGAAHLSVHGSGSLQLLEAIGRPVESARGTFALDLGLDASPGGVPELAGSLEVRDAALDVGLPVGPTETAGRVRFERSLIYVERVEGRLGGGTFAIGGSIDLGAGPNLTWKLNEVSTGLVPSLEHEISGSGTYDGTWEDSRLAGEIEIVRALYERRIEIRDFLPSFRRELARAPDEEEGGPRRVLRLDLHVFAKDELYIDNNFARIEGQADLKIIGTAERPRLDGRVRVIDGEVYFRDRTFEVRTAVVDFRPELGFDGYLNVIADSEITTPDATYTVGLQVSGRTDDVRVVMTADDPSLTQNDIFSLIAFGRTGAQLQKEGGGVGVGDLIGLAPGGGYADKLERGTAKLLRVDRFEIEPAFSRTTGEFEPQLSVGKNFTEDLSTNLASTFGVAARQILDVTYRLTPRISLLAGWESESQNQESAFSVLARFRFAFRDTPGFSLLHGRKQGVAHEE